jgi:hypothetical protein
MKKLLFLLPLAIAFCLISTGVSQSGSVYLSPTSVHFGGCFIGDPPCENSVTLYNTTSSAITISRETFVGDNGFQILTNKCGSKLNANSSCYFVLEFNQNAGGGTGEFTATFYVYDSASGSPQTASLTAIAYCRDPVTC